jgi:hypothetical protein
MARNKSKDYPPGCLLWESGKGKNKFYTGKMNREELIEKLENIESENVQFYLNEFDGEWKSRDSDPPEFRITIKEEYSGKGKSKSGSGSRRSSADRDDDDEDRPSSSGRRAKRYSEEI